MSPLSTLHEARKSLVALSRRHSRVPHEVEDVAHDIIVSALRRGTPVESETFLRTAYGAVRRHGAFLARSALRRRAREAWCAPDHLADANVVDEAPADEGAAVSALPPALRTTLFLLLLGLDKAELRHALGVTDAALRKRFQALRDQGPLERPELPIVERTPALSRLRRTHVQLLPRLATARLGKGKPERALAVGDPDGHGLIFVEALTRSSSTATSDVSAAIERTHAKGTPCSTAS